MPLTDTFLRGLKATGHTLKKADGGGLYIQVDAKGGGKYWRQAYRFGGKQKTLALGVYPDVSLKKARERREEARALLAQGIDPSEHKKKAKAVAAAVAEEKTRTFEAVAREWFETKTLNLTAAYRKQLRSRLENHIFPFIGDIPFSALEPAHILEAVRHTQSRGAIEMAHRLTQLAGKICRYARIVGYVKFDVAAGLHEALPPIPKDNHHATITDPAEIGRLLLAIDDYHGDPITRHALQILPYVFVRSVELRGAAWSEIDLAKSEWTIPAGRMKMRRPHVVPLARQVVNLFESLRDYSGQTLLAFPSPFSMTRCLSNMGLLNALRRMGYGKGEMTVHGFRGMASTLLNEQGYRPDVIEAQLAHGERDSVRRAYNHALYLDERRRMMQEWADYLDGLRESAGRSAESSKP